MNPLVILSVILVVIGLLGLAFLLSLRAALKLPASSTGDLRAEAREATDQGLPLILTVSGPRSVMIDRISVSRSLVAAAGASPPPGFELTGDEPVPDIESFEPDLDELGQRYEPDAPPDSAIAEETRRQYEETVALRRAWKAEYVSWTGTLRVKRGAPATLLVPMTAPEKATGEIVFAYSYRIGLLSGSSATTLICEGPE
jgi:hypothetical protein